MGDKMSVSVDLNSDVGESFGRYKLGLDEEVLKYVTSANIACGFHAGDPVIMERTVEIAIENDVGIGAHPGYPDLLGFGRRRMDLTPEEVYTYITYQIGALQAFALIRDKKIEHVKAHGALYNAAAVDYSLAKAIARAVHDLDDKIILLALANSEMVNAGRDIGMKVAEEVFADRAYRDDGTLVPRGVEGSIIKVKEGGIERF